MLTTRTDVFPLQGGNYGGAWYAPPPDVAKSMQASSKESNRVSDRWVKIPLKYYELESTDLEFKVKGGEQSEKIELKD